MTMRVPSFFEAVAPIVIRDPLAALLGAAEDGRIECHYVDAVRLAGHSCPTVASSWLMTARALAYLYPDALPERGRIKVELRGAQDEGTEGVSAMIAGAAGVGGFKGIAGRYGRRDLLVFAAPIGGRIRFTRSGTQKAVDVTYHSERVQMPPEIKAAMGDALAPDATADARTALGRRWQAWVRTILIDHADDPLLVSLEEEMAQPS